MYLQKTCKVQHLCKKGFSDDALQPQSYKTQVVVAMRMYCALLIYCCLMAAGGAKHLMSTDLSDMTVDDIMMGYQTNAFTTVQIGI
jgi:hypothetical protein